MMTQPSPAAAAAPTQPSVATQFTFKKNEPLDVHRCLSFTWAPTNGATSVFIGTVRDTDSTPSDPAGAGAPNGMHSVRHIYYEAYETMVRRELGNYCAEYLRNPCGPDDDTDTTRVAIEMRFGNVPAGETSIIICVSSVRRALANKMTAGILDDIKRRAPVWKKIVFTDGTECWSPAEKSEAEWARAAQH